MSVTSVDIGQIDNLLKDFDDFLETRIDHSSKQVKEGLGCRQAYEELDNLYLKVEKQQGRQALLDLEAAVNLVVMHVENESYKRGFYDGVRLLTRLLRG